MTVTNEVIAYTCDWTQEDGRVCSDHSNFSGKDHESRAREAGWGSYTNAYVRRSRWTTGAALWFCPLHATVFRANHGWGGLEGYKPPTKWWQSFFKGSAD